MAKLVYIPLASISSQTNYELTNYPIKNVKKMTENSISRSNYKQQPTFDQVSWEFLSDYINNSQSRHEKMRAKISEAIDLAKRLEEAAARERLALLKNEEEKRIQKENYEREQAEKKKAELNAYERPQSKALADSYLETTKEMFAMSNEFESQRDSNSSSLKMKLKLNINRRTGQITDSLKQIREVCQELIQLCYESRSFSKQAFSYCLVLLSSKLLAQAESQVSLHSPSAFPLALVAVEISTNVVEFSSILMASLIKKCCFIVPRYPMKTSTMDAYKIELGYLHTDGVVKETDSSFFERMSGLVSFYSAVIQTNSLSGKPNLLGLNMGWNWLAAILNLPPRPVTPYILNAFLEQASFSLYRKYGPNFEKLVRYILEKYLQLIPASSIAAKTRLELLCKEIISAGQMNVKEPVGRKFSP